MGAQSPYHSGNALIEVCRPILLAARGTSWLGMLQMLLKALDPSALRVTGPDSDPIPIAATVANVQSTLGIRSGTAELPGAQT